MKIEHKILANNIHLLTFENQKDLTSTFIRFQEYYESPSFRNKVFSFDEFRQWYIKNSPQGIQTGKFTYFSDWNGFNIPSYVLEPFIFGKFDPLSKQEKIFLEIFKTEKNPFYIIGVHKKNKNMDSMLKHEITHGMFYTNKKYRDEVLSVISDFNIEPIKKELRLTAAYHEEVLEDEVNAYSIDTRGKLKTPIPAELTKRLRALHKKYS